MMYVLQWAFDSQVDSYNAVAGSFEACRQLFTVLMQRKESLTFCAVMNACEAMPVAGFSYIKKQ